MYVHDSNTNTVVEITDATVVTFTTTTDNLFYVTVDGKLYQSDFTGSFHTLLYQATQGTVTCLDYFNGNLTFIEGGIQVKVLDVEEGTAEEVFANKDICSIFFFDDDKFIWRDKEDQPYYYNITTKGTVSFNSEHEVNCVVAPYQTPILSEEEQASILAGATSRNNISFPLIEYGVSENSYNFSYATALTYFNNGIKSVPSCYHVSNSDPTAVFDCKNYAGSRQCDGFAKYAHDRYYHLSTVRSSPSFVSDDMSYEVTLGSGEAVRDFFADLIEGTFIRYGKIKDGKHVEAHSVVVSEVGGSGVWVYECNQDWKCGVFYTYYSFDQIAKNYLCAHYYVKHSFSGAPQCYNEDRHKLICENCSAYIVPKHAGSQQAFSVNETQHQIKYSCCSGYLRLEDHVYSGNYPECLECGYSPALGYSLREETIE